MPSIVSESEIYKEQHAHFRAMNDILYKIPPLFTAVIGGLWYFAATTQDTVLSIAVFLFAGVASFLFIGVMSQFRLAFGKYISNINKLEGDYKVTIRGQSCWPSTVKLIQWLLVFSVILSLAGAYYKYRLPTFTSAKSETAQSSTNAQAPTK